MELVRTFPAVQHKPGVGGVGIDWGLDLWGRRNGKARLVVPEPSDTLGVGQGRGACDGVEQ